MNEQVEQIKQNPTKQMNEQVAQIKENPTKQLNEQIKQHWQCNVKPCETQIEICLINCFFHHATQQPQPGDPTVYIGENEMFPLNIQGAPKIARFAYNFNNYMVYGYL